MEASQGRKTHLPMILLAAVVQGWLLYALYAATAADRWPATQPGWLIALHACALFVPLTIQLLSEHLREARNWIYIAILTVLAGYFGWHAGATALTTTPSGFIDAGTYVGFALVFSLWWLIALPFLQCRLQTGRWRPQYSLLFSVAWRNKLTLAEAIAFTVLFWALLGVWQMLFHRLGISFFRELFSQPVFIYPVTALTFGIALHLIGSIERLTSVVMEQVLSVLKWLGLLAGLLLTFFSLTLLFKLPGQIASGQRVIDATWLLWLIAITVLLINAAYRDGTVTTPYPRPLALALRAIVPLTAIVSLAALYSLLVRISEYGFTVERFWGLVVGLAAVAYSLGYSYYAWRDIKRSSWMNGMSTANTVTALALLVTLSLAMTPILSPYRITANSQFRAALAEQHQSPERSYSSVMHTLRFYAGTYGMSRLRELAELQDHPAAESIRTAARTALEREHRWDRLAMRDTEIDLTALALHPAGRALPPELQRQLQLDTANNPAAFRQREPGRIAGLFVDLNGDEIDEFVLLVMPVSFVYEQQADESWQGVGVIQTSSTPWSEIEAALRAEDYAAVEPAWRELRIGGESHRLIPQASGAFQLNPATGDATIRR